MTRHRAARLVVGIALVISALACRDAVAPDRAPTAIEMLSGDGQEAVTFLGSQTLVGPLYLPEPLRVRVTDPSGAPVSGARVTWTTTGGGLFESPTEPIHLFYLGAASLTDSAGIAELYWSLWNEAPGSYAATVALPGVDSVTFTGFARAGPLITELLIDPDTVNVADGGASATVTMHVIDDRTAATSFEYAWIVIGPAEAPTEGFTVDLDRTSGAPTNAEFRGEIPLPEDTRPGDWTIVRAAAGWGCGPSNRLELTGQGLDTLGFSLGLYVKSEPAEATMRSDDGVQAHANATSQPASC